MSIGVAADKTQLSGNYIPEVWSLKLLRKFYDACVLNHIANNDYTGEIKDKGDKVYIRTVPDVTIRDYVKGQKLTYEDLDSDPEEMTIDYAKYWGFPANLVDIRQADIPFIDAWSKDASSQMKIKIETDVFADVYSDADSSNSGASAGAKSGDIDLGVAGAPRELTKDNILDIIVDINVVLDEQSVPSEDRNIILPAWAVGMIKKSDLKDASITGDGKSILRSGRIGMIDGMTIYKSNLLNSAADGSTGDTCYDIIACQKSALSFVTDITENEQLKNPDDFGWLVRGLQVFGYKVLQPTAMVWMYACKG